MFINGDNPVDFLDIRKTIPQILNAYLNTNWEIYLAYRTADEYLYICRQDIHWLTCFSRHDRPGEDKICTGSLRDILSHIEKCAGNGTSCDYFGGILKARSTYDTFTNKLKNTLALAMGVPSTEIFEEFEEFRRTHIFRDHIYGRAIDL